MPETFQTVTLLMPVFNEDRWLEQIVRKAAGQPLPGGLRRQFVIVDDGSTDHTPDVLRALPALFPEETFVVLAKPANEGKGAALRDGWAKATGDILLIQDADLEYDPSDYPALLQPILDDRADAVFGSRLAGNARHRMPAWQRGGNAWLTALCNRLSGMTLSDMECGYKVFTKAVYSKISIQSRDFGVEPELALKTARLRLGDKPVRVVEVGVTYSGRDYASGKKIRKLDALKAVFQIFRFRFFS
jgi:glycosyltransferase involved in cell wall biosynthesis